MTNTGKGPSQADTETVKAAVEIREIDLGEIAEERNAGNQKYISPNDKLKFAHRVLLAIFVTVNRALNNNERRII